MVERIRESDGAMPPRNAVLCRLALAVCFWIAVGAMVWEWLG